jgi:hypothetical protein
LATLCKAQEACWLHFLLNGSPQWLGETVQTAFADVVVAAAAEVPGYASTERGCQMGYSICVVQTPPPGTWNMGVIVVRDIRLSR